MCAPFLSFTNFDFSKALINQSCNTFSKAMMVAANEIAFTFRKALIVGESDKTTGYSSVRFEATILYVT